MVKRWENERTGLRRAQEIHGKVNLERGLVMSPSRRRTGDGDHTITPRNKTTHTTTSPTSTTKKRKLNYPVIEESWGLNTSPSKQKEGWSPTHQTPTSTNQDNQEDINDHPHPPSQTWRVTPPPQEPVASSPPPPLGEERMVTNPTNPPPLPKRDQNQPPPINPTTPHIGSKGPFIYDVSIFLAILDPPPSPLSACGP